MKKYITIILAASAVMAASCSKHEVKDLPSSLKTTTITATAGSTKTELGDDGSYLWSTGDQLSVFNASGDNYSFQTEEGGSATAEFSSQEQISGTLEYALYPASTAATCDGGVISTSIPVSQDGTISNALSVGTAVSENNFQFINASSVIKMTVNGADGIRKISIEFGEAVAGDVAVDAATGEISGATSNTVEVSSSSNLSGEVYFAIAPTTSKGIIIRFVDADGFVAVKSATLSKGFSAGTIKNIGTVANLNFIKELYVLGDACDTGWSLDAMPAFESKGNGIFEWEGHLMPTGSFRLPLQRVANGWWPCLVKGAENGTLAIGKQDADNNPFTVDTDGVWHITVDTWSMTYTITYVGEYVPGGISELYVLGSACDAGWSIDAMTAFDNKGNGVFEWEGHLNSTGEFRFPLQKMANVWWPCLVKGVEDGTLVVDNDGSVNRAFTVSEEGLWHITVNVVNMTYSMEKVVSEYPNFQELYILGDATSTGWSLDIMESFTKTGNGIFEWEGNLYAAPAVFRFPLQKVSGVWWPCVIMGETAGTIAIDNDGTVVRQFSVPTAGVWHIAVDSVNMTYTISPVTQ